MKPTLVRSSTTSLDPQTLQKLVETFRESLEKAIAPLRQDLAAMNTALKRLVDTVTPSADIPAGASRPRLAAAAVEAPGRRASTVAADEPGCLVPRCAAPVLAKQLCETHYRIMRRAAAGEEEFDPGAQRPARARAASKHCEEQDCDEAHYAKGLCRRHYMAARSRIRAAERQGEPLNEEKTYAAQEDSLDDEPITDEEETPTFTLRNNGGLDRSLDVPLFEESPARPAASRESLPTAEVVARVVVQHRGGLDRVAEVLGRNKRTLKELLGQLDLIPFVTRVREEQRQRILSTSLPDRLDDLLFREKLLDDLGCLKEVDDRTRFEIRMRCTQLAKSSETVDEVLQQLGREFKLDDNGMKRLIWRYDLRRQLRSLNLKPSAPPTRTRV